MKRVILTAVMAASFVTGVQGAEPMTGEMAKFIIAGRIVGGACPGTPFISAEANRLRDLASSQGGDLKISFERGVEEALKGIDCVQMAIDANNWAMLGQAPVSRSDIERAKHFAVLSAYSEALVSSGMKPCANYPTVTGPASWHHDGVDPVERYRQNLFEYGADNLIDVYSETEIQPFTCNTVAHAIEALGYQELFAEMNKQADDNPANPKCDGEDAASYDKCALPRWQAVMQACERVTGDDKALLCSLPE